MAIHKRQKVLSPVQRILGEDFNLSVFLTVFKRSIIWIILFMVGTFTMVFLYLRYTYPTYQSSSRLIYKLDIASSTLDFLGSGRKSAFNNVEAIRSSLILNEVIDSLPLEVSYFEEGNILNNEFYKNSPFKILFQVKDNGIYDKEIRFKFESPETYAIEYGQGGDNEFTNVPFGSVLTTPHFEIIASLSENNKANFENTLVNRSFFFVFNSRRTIIHSISDNITITPYRQGGQILQLDLSDKIALRAADILNEIAKVYIKRDVEMRQRSNDNILVFLNKQIDKWSDDIVAMDDSLKEFKLSNKLLSPETITNKMLDNMSELEKQKLRMRLERQSLDWLEQYVKDDKNLNALSTEFIDLKYKGYTHYLDKIAGMQDEIEQLRLSLKEPHLQIKFLRDQIEETKNDLFENLENARKHLDLVEQQLDEEITKFNTEVQGLSEVEAEYLQLSRIKNLMETYFMNFLEKRLENEIKKASIVENYQVLESAIPGTLISPKRQILQIGGLAVGLVLGLGLVVLRYILISKVQTLQEIEDNSDVPILGTIPNFRKAKDKFDLIVYDNPKSLVTEAFRSLRSNLEFIYSEPGPKTMAVTSTVSGEGKTYIAINLAGILHMAGKKIILLDLDLRKPKIHKIFKVDNMEGMSTILIGKHHISECIHQAGREGYDFVTSGPLPPNPAELILSQNLKKLIDELKESYDYILIDTPPVGLVADAIELIKRVNYPLYVIRHDFSRREFINYPNKLYHDSAVKNLSVILNDVPLNRAGYGRYNYNYGYGYGEGYYTDTRGKRRSIFKRLFNK
jgi:tyrosine-protein kinase Etk/Wzc